MKTHLIFPLLAWTAACLSDSSAVQTVTPNAPVITAVLNGASSEALIAPAAWMRITGANLAPAARTAGQDDMAEKCLPTRMDGVEVRVNGSNAYLFSIAPEEIQALPPDDIGEGSAEIEVIRDEQSSGAVTVPMEQAAPRWFQYSGTPYVQARRENLETVSPPGVGPGCGAEACPAIEAEPGETILLYGTGFGKTEPQVSAGSLPDTPLPLTEPVRVRFDDAWMDASGVLSAPGLYQIKMRVPLTQRDGDAEVAAELGSATTKAGKVAVKQREPRSAWRPRAPLPTRRAQARAVALNGKIYVLGGCPGTPSLMGPQVGLVEIYDPTTDSWVGSVPMPVLHGSGGAAAVGGKLYVIDGADGAVYEFDPKTAEWTRKPAQMPTVRTIFATAVGRGKIYTIGGLAGDLVRGFRNSNAVEIYDPATDTWESAPPILVRRHAMAAATWNDTIFIIGGDADSPYGGPNIRTNLVEAYDLASNTWSRRAPSPMALHYHPVAFAQGKIYAFEGDVAAVLAYDPARDSWTQVSSKPHVRWAETAAEAFGRIYLFGGWDNPNFDTVLQYNEEYDPATDPIGR